MEKLIAETMKGNLSEVRKIIDMGADLNSPNRLGVTPLMVACQWNRLEIARFLLDHGADLEPVERSCGRNALMYACLSGNADLVKLLLDRRAGIDSRDGLGRTPLMMASSVGSPQIVRLLVQAGANIHLKDNYGVCALDWAAGGGRRDIVELLGARETVEPSFVIGFDKTDG